MAFLKELVTIEKGKKVTPSEEVTEKSIRFIQIGDLRTNKNYQYCEVDASYKIANQDDIIIAWDGANAGQSSYGLEGAIGSTLALLKRKSNEYYTPFLGIYINSKFDYFQNNSTGATIPHLSRVSLDNLQIPLPPLDIQKKIADTLDKAQELIDKRKEQISALDKFLENLFLDMFGDPVSNPMGWEVKELKQVVNILTGYPFKSSGYVNDKSQIKICGGLIIMPDKIDWESANYWERKNVQKLDNYFLEKNDIVMAMDRPWISGGFKMRLIDDVGVGSLLIQRTAMLRGIKINQLFLYSILKSGAFTKHCKPTETTVPHISIKDINTFLTIIPPLDLQNQFASIVEKVEAEKTKLEASLKEMEDNFNSIMQRAFKGELF